MFSEQITPLLITWNEAPNLERTLAALAWARVIIVVDSGSSDDTLAILARHPQVKVFQRRFDSLANQCAFGLRDTGIETEWVLSLDADHVLTDRLVHELHALAPPPAVAGYESAFDYWVCGRPLRGSLYPPRVVLFRRSQGRFVTDAHTHRVELSGQTGRLEGRIRHDDRKPLSRWLMAQDGFALAEVQKLCSADASSLGWPDRVRKLRLVAPFAAPLYCLLVKGVILDGWAGWHYAFQRGIAEAILSLRLMEQTPDTSPPES